MDPMKRGLSSPKEILKAVHNRIIMRKISRSALTDQQPRRNLIIVCCHAIWKGDAGSGQPSEDWVTEDFQKGEVATFVKHISEALKCLYKDKSSVVVFSGGPTKQDRTDLAEGQSYMNFAYEVLRAPKALKNRILAENYATDSYQNLLFSIILFRHEVGNWPDHVTVISHAFKRNRFVNSHCISIHWPLARVDFKGIDPPENITSKASLKAGESKATEAWVADKYGIRGTLLAKRLQRGWDPKNLEKIERGPYADEGVDVNDHNWITTSGLGYSVHHLLRYDGGPNGNTMFPLRLPWMTDPYQGRFL